MGEGKPRTYRYSHPPHVGQIINRVLLQFSAPLIVNFLKI
jgi:hypothetical protein